MVSQKHSSHLVSTRISQDITTKSPAVARIADCTGCCQWLTRSSKVDEFHFIWKDVCHFQLVINSNLGRISHHFWYTAIDSLKPSTNNCGQTAADGDMVTTGSL